MKRLMTGNDAAATAAKLAGVQVIAAYPITPQTSIAEKLAEAAASGELNARYMKVESETRDQDFTGISMMDLSLLPDLPTMPSLATS